MQLNGARASFTALCCACMHMFLFCVAFTFFYTADSQVIVSKEDQLSTSQLLLSAEDPQSGSKLPASEEDQQNGSEVLVSEQDQQSGSQVPTDYLLLLPP